MKNKRLFAIALFGLLCLSVQAIDFTILRERLRTEITMGPMDYNPLDTRIMAYISHLEDTTDVLWSSMRTDTAFLWDDQPLLTDSKPYTPYHVHKSYIRLHLMTRAWVYPSSRYYHNAQLLSAIRYGLNLLYQRAYNTTSPYIGNWWEWRIGIPFDYSNIVSLLYEQLSSDELAQYEKSTTRSVRDCVAHGNLTYANQASVCRNLLFIGTLTGNEKDLQIACDNAIRVFIDYTTIDQRNEAQAMYNDILRTQTNYQHDTPVWWKEGLYPDGTFIQHIAMPYIGTYGVENIELAADMAILLEGTAVHIPDTIIASLPFWITKTYLPAMYRGQMMLQFMGRGTGRNPYYYARCCLLNIFKATPLIEDLQLRQQLVNTCAQMLGVAGDDSTPYEKMDPAPVIVDQITQMQRLAKNSIPTKPFSMVYAAGDRVVHQTEKARVGIAMSSNRIGKYEAFITAVSKENTTGWYTGDGMTNIYTPDDPMHYVHYLQKIDCYRIPGATMDTQHRDSLKSDMILYSHDAKVVDVGRAGGVTLGANSVAGMQLLGWQGDLMAKKAWFCFDKEVVCLGSDIHQKAKREVLTIVENRSTKAPIVMERQQYAYLEGTGGYYFPNKTDFKTNMTDLGAKEIFITHGVAPQKASYCYVLLPGFSLAETQHYVLQPEVQILANTDKVQAVTKPQQHLTGAFFWDKAKIQGVESDGVAIVLWQQHGQKLTLSVTDPTWDRKQMHITLDGEYQWQQLPARVKSEVKKNKTCLTIDATNLMGQTLTFFYY